MNNIIEEIKKLTKEQRTEVAKFIENYDFVPPVILPMKFKIGDRVKYKRDEMTSYIRGILFQQFPDTGEYYVKQSDMTSLVKESDIELDNNGFVRYKDIILEATGNDQFQITSTISLDRESLEKLLGNSEISQAKVNNE